ncbi:uncharacterized protein LTR77_001334 [Saxophila tyrrhenica]|uniref:Uncharacterized protein n=1 Tax=Saxophila tyrrhenica TaxID=1690608 RepID=A0AAV9PL77_9PEZI|nr:hypothetical protein LTR77_001334 [Saxophila tyrrhenica]
MPPYKPPERVTTPEGLPSWRGQIWTPAPPAPTFFRQLRRRLSGSRTPAQTVRMWRPPVSGYGTPFPRPPYQQNVLTGYTTAPLHHRGRAALDFDLDGSSPTREENRRRHSQSNGHSPTSTPPVSPLTETPPPTNPIRRMASWRNKPLPPLPVQAAPAESEPGPAPRLAFATEQPGAAAPRHSVISFAARNHIRHHRHRVARGTWRTRMKRTKCWRCELEARRNRSSEALSRFKRKLFCDADAWEGWWDRLKAKMKWTCFCRYKGYEEEREDEDGCDEGARIGRERVRLGRFGAMLRGAVSV